jgi:16S rRNA processing protein RimM
VIRRVVVGKIAGVFGVKGWVKVHSYTDPPENILHYSPWQISSRDETREIKLVDGQRHGNSVIAKLEGVITRDQAILLRSWQISVARDQFPKLPDGEYYWADLVGLEVRLLSGTVLGKVTNMMATGANDVMVVQGERERLIPFVTGEFVKEVDLAKGLISVDWDPDF